MKKLYPDVPDVPQSVANRAVRIVEKHLKIHRVSRAQDLPEDAKVRLYRDLHLFLQSGQQPPEFGPGERRFSMRSWASRLWEKIEDFLSG